jgi:adenine/guanine phosphoribosyltransferase-like PRPP-binding protein
VEFWQAFETADAAFVTASEVLAPMPDGTALRLPLRDYGTVGVAGFIANQASFAVVRRLAAWMTETAAPHAPEVVVGLPTLGQVFAPLIAEALGHANWVAPGYSRKLWYEERLSVTLASSTTPRPRRLWLDPRVVHRLAGRRVLLVDDVIATGRSAQAGIALLAAAGVRPVALCIAMAQGDRWRADWPNDIAIAAAFATPLYRRDAAAGWAPVPGSLPAEVALRAASTDRMARTMPR